MPEVFLPPPVELRSDAVTRETIDVVDGLERVMGDRGLYSRMLRRFRDDYREGALPIRLAVASGDLAGAHRIVHSLKGAAGMIGARRLHERATQLEESMRTESPDLREKLASLITEFARVIQLLEVLLDGCPPSGIEVHVPSRLLLNDAALSGRLLELVANRDGGAVDLLEESGASLRVILGDETLGRVRTALNHFDYDGALEALGETMAGHGI